jgi:uncharacterized membrane protein
MIVFAVVGLVVSSYLAYLSILPPASCPIGDVGILSCNEVIYSKYAHFYGVSVALLGLGWFIVVIGLIALSWHDVRFIRWVVAWSVLGAGGVAAFVYTEIFLLGSICPLCTAAHTSGIAILVISILDLRATRDRS